MSLDEKNKLQLACKNSEDLKVISAYLQDSITNLGDMIFLKKVHHYPHESFLPL